MADAGARGEQIVDLELGFDLFEAQVIAESVRSAGYDVRLREMTTEGVALSRPLVRHILLVRTPDLEAVRQIVDQSSSNG